MAASGQYAKNVFVNCPYDQGFSELLKPLLFTVVSAGLQPRLALEGMDSGPPRIERILKLIRESKFAIHDLSRLQADRAGEFSRLNMPFELGLDFGCRWFGESRFSDKRILILEKDRYRYQAALSDISGSDIKAHNDDPEEIVAAVRDWLNSEAGSKLPGPSTLWDRFNEFMAADYDRLLAAGFKPKDIARLPMRELLANMQQWIAGKA